MQKNKKSELGPLNLSKTHYKPYLSSKSPQPLYHPQRPSDSNSHMIINMPPAQQTHQIFPDDSISRYRQKIEIEFSKRDFKLQEKWRHYIDKAEILSQKCTEWVELQTELLTIIYDLVSKHKKLADRIDLLNSSQSSPSFETNFLSTTCNNNNRICKKLEKLNHTQSYKPGKFQLTELQNKNTITHNTLHQQESQTKQAILQAHNKSKYEKNKENEYLKMNIIKLEKRIEILKKERHEKEVDFQERIQKFEKSCNSQLQQKYFFLKEEKAKYENELDGKKFQYNLLAKEFVTIKEKHEDLSKKYAQLHKSKKEEDLKREKIKEYSKYKELWLMENEQIEQLKEYVRKLKSEKQNQVKKNIGFKQKLKQLSKNFNYNYNLTIENQRDKQDLNKVLKDFRDWLKFIAVPRINKGFMDRNTFFPEMIDHFQQTQMDQFTLKDDGTNYRLLRPNFFIYFQTYENIIIAQKKFPQRKIMPPEFFLTIRAILDAMYLHFIFSSSFHEWKNFPEFTISYIEKFQISPINWTPCIRKIPCQGEEKINFLLNIFNLEAANTWECDLFRSFLLEDYTLDQIYFYLDCRNSLLKGSHLNNNFGSGDVITFINSDQALQVVQEKLENYDNEMISRIKKFIDSKKKTKSNVTLIDLNFVLKLLLEVYSVEKIKSERFFYNNFKIEENQPKISYTEYSAFLLKNFAFLSKSDVAQLYRQTYSLGVGRITYKTIHFVCLMKGLFIPLLQKKFLKNKNKFSNRKSKILEDALFLNMQNEANKIAIGFEQFGLEEVLEIDLKINQFLNETVFLGQNKQLFEIRYLQILNQMTKIKSIVSWKCKRLKKTDKLSQDQIRQRISQLLAYTYQCLEDTESIKKNREMRKNAIQKLTKNFKIRIQQSFLEFTMNDKSISEKLVNLQKCPPSGLKDEYEEESQKQINDS